MIWTVTYGIGGNGTTALVKAASAPEAAVKALKHKGIQSGLKRQRVFEAQLPDRPLSELHPVFEASFRYGGNAYRVTAVEAAVIS